MKKRNLFLALAVAILVGCGAEAKVQTANPWTTMEKADLEKQTGYKLNVPEGADDIEYSYLESENLAQVSFKLNNADWVYRVQATNELEDISGMYYDWEINEAGHVGDYEAQFMAYAESSEETEFIDDIFAVHVVNWYNVDEGTTHSLSASGKDLNGMDIQVYAEQLQQGGM